MGGGVSRGLTLPGSGGTECLSPTGEIGTGATDSSRALFAAREYAVIKKNSPQPTSQAPIGRTLGGEKSRRPRSWPVSPGAPPQQAARQNTRKQGKTAIAKDKELVVELIDLQGVGQPLSEVHLRVSVIRKSNESFIVLGQGHTSKRFNTRRPTWYAFHQMVPFARPSDIIQVEVIGERNIRRNTRIIGTAQCTVEQFGMESELLSLPLKELPQVTIRARRVFSRTTRKRLYLVRHGESRWNRAQARRNVVGMLAFRDHPLNVKGAQQAVNMNKRWRFEANMESSRREEDDDILNQTFNPAQMNKIGFPQDQNSSELKIDSDGDIPSKSFEAGFFEADAIFSSPLTRSLQTALLGLQYHPCALQSKIKLLTCAREVQNLLGKDSMGVVCGEESFTRAKQLLQQECGNVHSAWEAGVSGVDPYDAESEWWIATKESRSSVVSRMEDFINTIHYRPETNIIVVGHSLFFRQLFQYLPCQLDTTDPAYEAKQTLLEQLRLFKIENCGIVGLDLDFEHFWPHMRKYSSLARLLPDELAFLETGISIPSETSNFDGMDGLASPNEEEEDITAPSHTLEAVTIMDVKMLFGSCLSNAPDESGDVLAQTT